MDTYDIPMYSSSSSNENEMCQEKKGLSIIAIKCINDNGTE